MVTWPEASLRTQMVQSCSTQGPWEAKGDRGETRGTDYYPSKACQHWPVSSNQVPSRRTQPFTLSSWGPFQSQTTIMVPKLWVGGGGDTGSWDKWPRKHPQLEGCRGGEVVSLSDWRGSHCRHDNQPNFKSWSLPGKMRGSTQVKKNLVF